MQFIQKGFFDFHTHILPGVDDGSSSMEETKEMLLQEVREGVHTIIATPHYDSSRPQNVEELLHKKDMVQDMASEISQDLKIFLGNELFFGDSIVEDLKSGKALTLAGSRYVLVEFKVSFSYDAMFKGLSELIQAGYAPIIAHVERYQCLRKKKELILELIELGCYIQMNTKSLLGGPFNMEARYHKSLVKDGLIHLLSSDCHDTRMRPPLFWSAVESLYSKESETTLSNMLHRNPSLILENKYI